MVEYYTIQKIINILIAYKYYYFLVYKITLNIFILIFRAVFFLYNIILYYFKLRRDFYEKEFEEVFIISFNGSHGICLGIMRKDGRKTE